MPDIAVSYMPELDYS